jgi:hypothetical protein
MRIVVTISITKMHAEAIKLRMMIHGPAEVFKLPLEGMLFGNRSGKTTTFL